MVVDRKKRLKQYDKMLNAQSLFSDVSRAMCASFDIDSKKNIESDVTNYVLAPALNEFVVWVIKEAIDRGIKRLYFLARDAYLMYKIAIDYVEKYNIPIELRYLYCSRFSIRVPMFHKDIKEAIRFVTLGGLDVTLRKMFRRAAFDENQITDVVQSLDKNIFCWNGNNIDIDSQIPRTLLGTISKELGNNKIFIDYLKQNSLKEYPMLTKYLIQEGFLDDIPMAVVDSGWVGTMQLQLGNAIASVRNDSGKYYANKDLNGFYWGLYETPQGVNNSLYHTFYFSPIGNIKRKVYFSNCLFEGIFSAPHGMTLRYVYDEKQKFVIPELEAIQEDKKKFIADTEQNLKEYTKHLIDKVGGERFENVIDKIYSEKNMKIIEKIISTFMGNPTRMEADIYGKIYFSDDVLEYQGKQIAEPMTEIELTYNHLYHKLLRGKKTNKAPIKQSAWFEGSVMAYGKKTKSHLRSYRGYKYLLYYRKQLIWRKNNEL